MHFLEHSVCLSQHAFKKLINALAVVVWVALLLLSTQLAVAQEDEIESRVQRLSETEINRLRAIVNGLVPSTSLHTTLRQHFSDKAVAARTLGDPKAHIQILREAIALLPDAYLRNNLANQLAAVGEYDEADKFYQQAISLQPDLGEKSLSQANRLYLNYQKRDWAQLSIEGPQLQAQLSQAFRTASPTQRFAILRAQSITAQAISLNHESRGRSEEAIEQARESLRYAEQANALIGNNPTVEQQQFAGRVMWGSLRRIVSANRVAGKLSDAESALANFYAFSLSRATSDVQQAVIFRLASELRLAQKDFAGALRYANRALEQAKTAQAPVSETIPYKVNLLKAQIGGQNFTEAATLFAEFDSLAKEQPRLAPRLLYRLERGIVAIAQQQWTTAARVLESGYRSYSARWGGDHPTTVATQGLLGLALWRQANDAQKARALELMSDSVQRYLSSGELYRFENQGYNAMLRRWIFEAYLDASTAQGGAQAMTALAAADGLITSGTQLALGDAAIRAAASTPTLNLWVRQEQDARNEALALRRYLSGEAGGQASPLPQVAASMRERLAVLEQERKRLLGEIKNGFPDYENLVRPPIIGVAELGMHLKPHQAIIVLNPTEQIVHVWVVSQNGQGAYHKATITQSDLATRIQRLRNSVEFGRGDKPQRAFDTQAAHSLHQDLLAPLKSTLEGKTEIIVAASGVLAQIPFGLLLMDAPTNNLSSAAWLIRKAAITHVPSAGAWLQLQRIERKQHASEALMAWGDPAFDRSQAAISKAASAREVSMTRQSPAVELGAATARIDYSKIPALPETREELHAIATTLRADTKRDLFLGAEATRESVLQASKQGALARKRVIAFATHGLIVGDLPGLDQPALAMAADGREKQNPLSPLLLLEDVLGLKLNADWVVLSACNTAAADGKSEEALSGLARGFFYAGSRSLLVTHWAVESESAVHLTTNTFEHYMANSGAPKSESLRQAMLKVMAMPQYSHPAYWAPYVLVGDGGR